MNNYSIGLVIIVIALVVGGFLTAWIARSNVESKPYFNVTEMVQCRGTICNAVLEMDDIAILIPFDSTKVHVGDKIYLVK